MPEDRCPILIIEDNASDAFLLERALSHAGYHRPLHLARNGRQALEYLAGIGEFSDREKYPLPRLIFLDMTLPLVSGIEVLTWLNEHPELQIPLIVITASTDEREKRRALQMGVVAYLPKPPSVELIQKVVDRFQLGPACVPASADTEHSLRSFPTDLPSA